MAIGVNVLTQQDDLFGTAKDKLFNLADDILHGTAPLPPSSIRHDAVGTEVIAALNDGDKGAGRRLGKN